MKRCSEKAKQEILTRYMRRHAERAIRGIWHLCRCGLRWINIWEEETGKHFLTELPIQKEDLSRGISPER